MSQIIKVYLSLFMITVFVVLGVSLIGADTGVSNARAYHDSFVKQIEESNMSQTVIDSCKDNAASLGYTVTIHNRTLYRQHCNSCNISCIYNIDFTDINIR